jgi:hypothetical protein
MIDLRNKRLEFGSRDDIGTRAKLTIINGRPAVSTSLGELVLDSGATRLTLFGVRPDSPADGRDELRTIGGTQKIGLAWGKPLVIDGRKFWEGDAVAIPNRPEQGVDGLLPLGLFKAIYVCNSEGYVFFE